MRKTMKVLALAAFVVFAMSATMVNAKDAKVKVNGKCGMCKAKIEKAAKGVKGVKSASWDQKTKVLTLDYNEKLTNVKAIETTIAKIGYDAGDVKADAEARAKLPACCKENASESKCDGNHNDHCKK